jgi:precorrin-6Y C5,15-methyltransferase (decarboxylating)
VTVPGTGVTGPGTVNVVGVDGSPLDEPARAALDQADLVIGAAAHLRAVALPAGCHRIVLGPLAPALAQLRAAAAGRAVVLAGGDPGLFGIVARLRREGFTLRVFPGVSSIAAVFARLGLPWESAVVVSTHGRGLSEALNVCRAMPVTAVLTGPGTGPAEIGAGLVGWPRRIAVGERLGSDQERLVTGLTPEQVADRVWAEPNIVVTLPVPGHGGAPCPPPVADLGAPGPATIHNQPAAAPRAGWALPEEAYEHRDSMITKREVRALAVARLRPRLGRMVWDVGAGSGSVGIECASFGAAVIAVDCDPRACELVHDNATRHEVGVRVVPGRAPQALAGLPDPDAVFVGGGGTEVLDAVARRGPTRLVATLAGLDRLVTGVDLLRGCGYRVDAVQLSASRLADLGRGSLRLTGTNPVVVLTGEQP